jgi:hypothetical protein
MEIINDDYRRIKPTDHLLYKWAKSILNEVVLWEKLRKLDYIFNDDDKSAYNDIKEWNPYLKSLSDQYDYDKLLVYIDGIDEDIEKKRLLDKFDSVRSLHEWIVARLENNINDPMPVLPYLLHEYFFLGEHREWMEMDINGLTNRSFSLPTDNQPPFMKDYLDTPFSGKPGIITMVSTFLWLRASRSHIKECLLMSSDMRDKVNDAYEFLLTYSAPNLIEKQIQKAGYYIHYYQFLNDARNQLKEVVLKSKNVVVKKMLLINFDQPRKIHILTATKDHVEQRPIATLSMTELDFEVETDKALIGQIKSNIFILTGDPPRAMSVNENSQYLPVTPQESLIYYKNPLCLSCLDEALFHEVDDETSLFCSETCQEEFYQMGIRLPNFLGKNKDYKIRVMPIVSNSPPGTTRIGNIARDKTDNFQLTIDDYTMDGKMATIYQDAANPDQFVLVGYKLNSPLTNKSFKVSFYNQYNGVANGFIVNEDFSLVIPKRTNQFIKANPEQTLYLELTKLKSYPKMPELILELKYNASMGYYVISLFFRYSSQIIPNGDSRK